MPIQTIFKKSALFCFLSVSLLLPSHVHATQLPAGVNKGWWQSVQDQLKKEEYFIRWDTNKHIFSSPNRQQNLRFYYQDNGFTVEPRVRSHISKKTDWNITFTLAGYGRNDLFVPVFPSAIQADHNNAFSEDQAIRFNYTNDKYGMRQDFLVKKRPDGKANLQLRLHTETDLIRHVSKNGFLFTLADNTVAMKYNDLHVWDSTGKKLTSKFLLHRSGDVLIDIDDSSARYPITIDPLSSTADWTAESNMAGALFGAAVAIAGDINNDGYDDVIIGAYEYDNAPGDNGRVFVYHGSSTGLSSVPDWSSDTSRADHFFGTSVASAGDVNGDQYDDVIIGANWQDNDQTRDGSAYVFFGSADGLSQTPDWTADGFAEYDEFGTSVSSAGDVNNDGYDDIIIGANRAGSDWYDEGEAYVFLGSASGPASSPAWTRRGGPGQADFGCSVSTAGDINGDGYDDIIVGSRALDNGSADEGKVYVFHGSATGLPTVENWSIEGNVSRAGLGSSVSSAGDINGDGYDDIIVGGGAINIGLDHPGMVRVFYGSATGLSLSPDWSVEGNDAPDSMGSSVSSAGDVNNDGYDDVIVGAYRFDGGLEMQGKAFLYYGSETGLSASPAWTVEGGQNKAYLGIAVGGGGDINGDGFSDFIVGASYYDNGETNEGRAYLFLGSTAGVAVASDWNDVSGQNEASLGFSVFTAGDVNGDGYSDIIAGAPFYDNGETDEGRTFVYHGSANGLSQTPNWTAESNQANSFFGNAVSTAGDVNNDGYSDVVIGAYEYDAGQQTINQGKVFVYHGSANGLSETADWSTVGVQTDESFGFSVGSAGDVNGDGYSDIIVGSSGYDTVGDNNAGLASVYYGSSSGLSTTVDWNATGEAAEDNFATSVATAGDVNGDGYSDIIIGAANHDNGEIDEGRCYLYLGSAGGLAEDAAWNVESNQENSHFGNSVATAGDVNGDGYSDVIVGAPFYDNGGLDKGKAFIYNGSAEGLSAESSWTAEGKSAGDLLGTAVAPAGDVNGDGYADVLIGAKGYSNGENQEGKFSLYLGSSVGLNSSPITSVESDQPGAEFGNSVAPAGDVNGDGYSDILIGSYRYNRDATNEGGIFVFHGGPLGLANTPAWTTESNQESATLGYSVSTAGDVNGDGFSDVIVGAFQYDNGETDEGRIFVYHGSATGVSETADWSAENNEAGSRFGFSVSTAGDVNGDGFDDIITGADFSSHGEQLEGRAYVYHGSSTGLNLSPNWVVESNMNEGTLGYAVSTAGDVNGDGYADVVVGAYAYNGGEGAVFVYHGSDLGLSSTPDWQAYGPQQTDPWFGKAVSTAGDVNGDGYADIIVGAPNMDINNSDEGKIFVYHGSANGLSTDPQWSVAGDQDSAKLGISVALAGDINADGYADILASACYYDNDEENEGRVYAYFGSASGLSTTADWISDGNHKESRYGYSVSSAGDINGDGYSDILIGAYNYSDGFSSNGAAFLFKGNASGLPLTPDTKLSVPQSYALFGLSVSTAGDVNGDGYSDIIIGAPYFDNTENAEGRAFIYYGNSLPGLRVNPQQFTPINDTRIGAGGRSGVSGEMKVSQFAKSPYGRTRGKLVYELRESGIPFSSGASIVNSVAHSGKQQVFSDLGISGTALNTTIAGLSSSSHYSWRSRTEYDLSGNPFQKFGPWRYYSSYAPIPFAGFSAHLDTYTITYAAADNGTISGISGQSVDSGMDGSEVTAIPNEGYHFVRWSDGSTTNPRTDLNVSGSMILTAYFSNLYSINTDISGKGQGSISSSPEGINSCNADCSAEFPADTTVTLTATASEGSTFQGWSGDCMGTGSCVLNMVQAYNIQAEFSKDFSWLLFQPAMIHSK